MGINKLRVLLEFHNEGNIFLSIGYGVLPLIFAIDRDDKWVFFNRNITTVAIYQELKDTLQEQRSITCEEAVRELGGQYMQSSGNMLIVTDGNLITAWNDTCLS